MVTNTGKTLKLNRLDYYITHLKIINSVVALDLTNKEINVLAHFLSMEGDIRNDLFGTTSRKLVREKCGITLSGLTNYLDSLQSKKCINKDDTGKLSLHPIINIGSNTEHIYTLKLIMTE